MRDYCTTANCITVSSLTSTAELLNVSTAINTIIQLNTAQVSKSAASVQCQNTSLKNASKEMIIQSIAVLSVTNLLSLILFESMSVLYERK